MDTKTKILICGDVEGKFSTLFSKVESINKKSGPFDLLLCVGNFFGVNNKEFDSYKNKLKKIPIPTYILGSNKEDHNDLYPGNDSEICENLICLGKKGVYVCTGGLKLAYLSGIAVEKDPKKHNYMPEDAIALRDMCLRGNSDYKGIDILLTSQWPDCVLNGAGNAKHLPQFHTYITAWLTSQIMPRYHVSGLEGIYYERPPYRNQNSGDFHIVTRFLGLARVGNPKKDKWIYAVNLCPINKMKISELMQKTIDETGCPFNSVDLDAKIFKKKRKVDPSQQYFFDMSGDSSEHRNKGGKNKHKKPKITFDQDKCWFCLSSAKVEKHLVITVGTSIYLAVPKGGIVDDHMLICPIEHHQSSIHLQPDVLDEINTFKAALRKFYEEDNKVPIFFERNYKTSHMQVQAIPVPLQCISKLKDTFIEEAESNGIDLQELEDTSRLDQVVPKGCPFFTIELPGEDILYVKIQGAAFPLNFPRQVLSKRLLLNVPDRIEWQGCVLSRDEEEELVGMLRKKFAPFEPE